MNILFFLTPKSEVAYIYKDYTMRQALEKMEYHRYSSIPIINKDGKYVGTITEGDLLWTIKNELSLDLRAIEDIPITDVKRRKDNRPVSIDAYIEDLISVGTIGLIKAVNTFNPEKKIKLATYASRCIENEILMYLRRNSKVKAEISFYEPLNIDWDGNELLLSDILGTENDTVYNLIEDEVDKELLFMALKNLNDREIEIVQLRFGLNGKRE